MILANDSNDATQMSPPKDVNDSGGRNLQPFRFLVFGHPAFSYTHRVRVALTVGENETWVISYPERNFFFAGF
jgi:hypothetical protein